MAEAASNGLRRKGVDAAARSDAAHRLAPTLSWPHLMALGVGAIVGTGIYTLTGVGAGLAGPGVIFSFLIAGAVCACAALAYAEMATMMPAAGSAYTYSYAVLGEAIAWVVGWSLILEYTVVCSAVAVGWSAHVAEALRAVGAAPPEALLNGPAAGGIVNLPAVLIALAVAGVLTLGTRESATANAALVAVKIAALALFVALALPAFHAANLHPLMPYGFLAHAHGEVKTGVMGAAALIFFAFYGFDAVSTAAEETKRPGRDLVIGIVGSMAVCTLVYVAVAVAALGASPYLSFSKTAAPLVFILRGLGQPLAATLVAGAAIVALPTVILAFLYGQSRIFFAMARDGLLPERLARIDARRGAPVLTTLLTGVIVAVLSGLLPLASIAELANAGTLAAFVAVSVCLLVLRVREPGRTRVFRCPAAWVIAPAAIAGCLYLFASLPAGTLWRFAAWNGVGAAVYVLYGRRSSLLGRAAASASVSR